jgi:hypothetical protein
MLAQESRLAGKHLPNSSCQKELSTLKNTGLHQTLSTLLHLEIESAHRFVFRKGVVNETDRATLI